MVALSSWKCLHSHCYTCLAVDPQLVVDCGSLPGPTNGAVSTSSGTNENDTAIYSCETGYNLNGEIIRTCEDDGQWAPDEPTCDRKLSLTAVLHFLLI